MLHKIRSWLASEFTRPGEYFMGKDGPASKSRYFQTLPGRHEQNAERFVAIAQVAIAVAMIAVALIPASVPVTGKANIAIALALFTMVASSMLRFSLSSRQELPDLFLDVLTFVDVAAILTLAISLSGAIPGSFGEFRFEPVMMWPIIVIGLRTMRAHPRPILVAGLATVGGWLAAFLVSSLPAWPSGGMWFNFITGPLLVLTILVGLLTYSMSLIRRSLRDLNATLETMPHGVAMFDDRHRLVVSNTQYSALYGLTDQHRKPGTSITDLIRYRHENGCFGTVNFDSHSTDWLNGFVNTKSETQELANGRFYYIRRRRETDGRIVTTTEDVTKQRRLEARIEHLAYHDAMTGLANRLQLSERLEQGLQQNRDGDGLTVFCIDLDQFKEINDTLGHHIGDALLVAVSERLVDCVRKGDVVARTGGDEFVVLQIGKCCDKRAASLAQRLIDELTKPFELKGHQVLTGVSIGIAFPDQRDSTSEDLMKKADMALYRAKACGRGTFRFFDESMHKRMLERRIVERDLRKALNADEFALHYQPIVSANRPGVQGVEALVRWNHPEKGLISPAEFVPIADEIGLAVPLGDWVIARACKDAARLPDDIKVSVNVSAAQFYKTGLAETVANALNSAGLPPGRLELEITESVLLDNSRSTIATLNTLHALGVQIALDDFGTGYSSLSYLKKFSFDRIKIDRTFVRDAAVDGSSREIIRTVVDLGRRLGMEITAEGVETFDQLERVMSDGCTAIQGFLVSRPLPLPELQDFLDSNAIREIFPPQETILRRVAW